MAAGTWVDSFEDHAFRDSWNQLVEFAEGEPTPNDPTVANEILGLARLVKAILYVDDLIEGCDPELTPLNIWDTVATSSANCLAELNQYKSKGNASYLARSNTHLDNILSYVRPYMMIKGNVAKSMGSSARHAEATIRNSLEAVLEAIQANKQEAEDARLRIGELENQLEETQVQLDSFNHEYLSSDNENSLALRIKILHQEYENAHTDITDYHQRLSESESGEDSIQYSVNWSKSEVETAKNELLELKKETESEIEYLREFYVKVHGQEKEDGSFVGGLAEDLRSRQKSLDAFKDKQEERYTALNEQIESLLPGATSAGLASAYHKLKVGCLQPMTTFTRLFVWSLIALIAGALFILTESFSFSPFSWQTVAIGDWQSIFASMISRLPLVAPIVWLAVFAAKRRSEYQRLYAEYAHKEAMANSYQGFKKQLEELDGADGAMLKELIQKVMEAYAYNASQTLGKRHSASTPNGEVKDALVNIIGKEVFKKG